MNAPLTTTAQVRAHSDAKIRQCEEALAALPEAERTAHLDLHVRWSAAQDAAQEAFKAYRKAIADLTIATVETIDHLHSEMRDAAEESLAAWYDYEESCARVFAAVRA